MKKKINIRFIMIAALAIVVTALSAMLVYYNILKEQVFGDLLALRNRTCAFLNGTRNGCFQFFFVDGRLVPKFI